MNKWYINGIEMTNRCIFLTSDYTVSSASVSRSVYSGGCASYVATKAKIGLKTIRLPVRIVQESTDMADSMRSWMLSMCLESKVEMMLPNGKTYVAALTDTGEVEKSAEGVIDFALEFTGYQRGEIVKAQTPNIMCFSTVPETPYRITATVGSGGSFTMAGVTFSDCAAGDVLMIDGMNGKVTKNGSAMDISKTDFLKFPFLAPGKNTVISTGAAAVEYYPIFM